MWRLALLFVSAIIALSVLPQNSALAVEYGGVGGRPNNPRAGNPRSASIFIHTLSPGNQADDAIKIYNNTDKTRTIDISAVDAVIASGGAFSCAQKVETPRDAGSWVNLSTNRITLKPSGSKTVPFTISVPGGVDVGEHNGCIAIQDISATKKSTKNSGITLGFRSAIRLVVTVPGKIIKDIELQKVTVNAAKDDKYTISPTAANKGNVSVDTDVTVSFKTLTGGALGHSKGTYPVLPKSTADWNLSVKKPFWGGFYFGQATISYNNDPKSSLGEKNGNTITKSLSSGLVFIPPTVVAVLIELLTLAIIITLTARLRQGLQQRRRVAKVWKTYTVSGGETISEIASRHGVSWKQLAAANKIKAPYALKNKQKIKVPTKTKYKV